MYLLARLFRLCLIIKLTLLFLVNFYLTFMTSNHQLAFAGTLNLLTHFTGIISSHVYHMNGAQLCTVL